MPRPVAEHAQLIPPSRVFATPRHQHHLSPTISLTRKESIDIAHHGGRRSDLPPRRKPLSEICRNNTYVITLASTLTAS